MSIESTSVSEITPADLSAGNGTNRKSLPTPVSHGAGVSITLDDDVAIYNALRDLWRERDCSPGDKIALVEDFEADYLEEDLALLWTSSRWKAGMDKGHGWKQWYSHQLQLRRVIRDPETDEIVSYRKPPIALNIVIEPQVEGLTYEDGNKVHLPFGEGTRLNIQTTYCERGSQIVSRAICALQAALGHRVDIDAVLDEWHSVRGRADTRHGDTQMASDQLPADIRIPIVHHRHANVRWARYGRPAIPQPY